MYEVSQWMWQFRRGKQRLGGLSVEKTAVRKDTALLLQELNQRGAETPWRSKADWK